MCKKANSPSPLDMFTTVHVKFGCAVAQSRIIVMANWMGMMAFTSRLFDIVSLDAPNWSLVVSWGEKKEEKKRITRK